MGRTLRRGEPKSKPALRKLLE